MVMIKSYTDLQQSKKLLELGIDKNTADFCYQQFCKPNIDYSNEGNPNGEPFYPTEPSLRHRNPVGIKTYINDKLTDIGGTLDSFKPGAIPCWSLAALIKLLPKGFLLMDDQGESGLYSVWVPGFNDSHIWKNNALDAAFEMICWLKKNNKL